MRFYDPTRCPDCGTDLPAPPAHAEACPVCDLRLTGQTALQLQSTLRYADQLLVQLRRPAPVAAAPYPAPAVRPEPERHGPRTTSVPAVLLGLGALCLLIAALIFLAVAWSWLGIGGRTAVLLGLTAGSTAAGLLLGRRGLRVAAEALTVVALGLVLLDVAGAGRAGWLGTHPDGLPLAAYGGVLAVAGLALLTHPQRLVGPQLAAATGLAGLLVGLLDQTDRIRPVALAGVLAFAALAWIGRALGVRVLPWLALAGGAASWLLLVGASLAHALDDPTVHSLWVEGRGPWLLAAAGVLAVPAVYGGLRTAVVEPALAAAAVLVTVAVCLPALDEGTTVLVLAAGAAALLWAAVSALHPRPWLVAPIALSALPLIEVATTLGATAGARLLDLGSPFTRSAGVRLAERVVDPHPALLVPVVLVLAAAAVAVTAPEHRRSAAAAATAPVALALLVTPALFAVPLAAVVVPLAGLGAVAALALRHHRPALVGPSLAGLAVLLALPSAGLTAATAAVLTLLAAGLALRGRDVVRPVSGSVLPVALAVTVWAAGEVAGLDPSYRSLLVLALVAGVAIARPQAETEVAAALAAGAAALGGIDTSTSLAVHLTLAGGLLTASSLLHRHRRALAWPGGLLLAAATWVRLAEIGVVSPEPYTMPSAVALVLVGLHRLTRDDRPSTATTLLPGLALATVPSLTWALAEPLTLRAALLGAGCLALVLLGARLRWSAPLLVGAAVGSALVLRESAPYLAETPQWVLIGTAGALLTLVGVTWERRVVEVRRAGTYVGRLR